jgi:hypothetical protein
MEMMTMNVKDCYKKGKTWRERGPGMEKEAEMEECRNESRTKERR